MLSTSSQQVWLVQPCCCCEACMIYFAPSGHAGPWRSQPLDTYTCGFCGYMTRKNNGANHLTKFATKASFRPCRHSAQADWVAGHNQQPCLAACCIVGACRRHSRAGQGNTHNIFAAGDSCCSLTLHRKQRCFLVAQEQCFDVITMQVLQQHRGSTWQKKNMACVVLAFVSIDRRL